MVDNHSNCCPLTLLVRHSSRKGRLPAGPNKEVLSCTNISRNTTQSGPTQYTHTYTHCSCTEWPYTVHTHTHTHTHTHCIHRVALHSTHTHTHAQSGPTQYTHSECVHAQSGPMEAILPQGVDGGGLQRELEMSYLGHELSFLSCLPSLYIWEPRLATCIHTLSVAHLSWLPRGEGCLWTLCCPQLKRDRHSCTYNHHNTSHYATTSDTHCEPIITLRS